MTVLAIGVDEPHFTFLTMPCASAAFMKAGAVSGVKSVRNELKSKDTDDLGPFLSSLAERLLGAGAVPEAEP